jgi:hypothetical protein
VSEAHNGDQQVEVHADRDAFGAGRDVTINNYFGQGEQHRRDAATLGYRAAGSLAAPPAGRLLAEVTDPFAVEVHLPILAEASGSGLPALPAYVPREHDTELRKVTLGAAAGGSGIAVLVGGSSTGKTRACWEALELLRDQPEPWRLWHPIDPSRPEAALRDLPAVGPRTVVWLNEAQFYLDLAADGLGERVAAGLRELLRDPGREPVLVLATLWPQFWDRLTARPPAGESDRHAQARELLAGRDITVPAAFTAAQVADLARSADPRLAEAAAAASNGQVVQFLAGAPELLARYRNAPPAARAVIDAAADARRLGMGAAVPLAFLREAAAGYLDDDEWDALGEDWLEEALAYTAAPCKGTRGPLTRIRPRAAAADQVLAYRLADYLDQNGRRTRRDAIPSASFWTAAASFAGPDDMVALAVAAQGRGLLRDAAILYKRAIAGGDVMAAVNLLDLLRRTHLAHREAAQWVASHAGVDDLRQAAWLLDALREAGADDQIAVLLARDPAAQVKLDDSRAVARLLKALRDAGAHDQVISLAARAVAHEWPEAPWDFARLLDALRDAEADDQVVRLARRAAGVSVDDPSAVAQLLKALRDVGAHEQVTRLADRSAEQTPVEEGWATARLLDALRDAGAHEQASALARRAVGQASLGNVSLVAWLVSTLAEAGADVQVAALVARDPAAHVPLDQPGLVAFLLRALRKAGADEQVSILLARDPAACTSLDDARSVSDLLAALRQAEAGEQVTRLVDRVEAHVALDDGSALVKSLRILADAGAREQVTRLADRAVTQARLDDPLVTGDLLAALRETGADEQVAALLARNPAAHVALDSGYKVAFLLETLREMGADEQVGVLLARNPGAYASDNEAISVAGLLDALREAGADQQVAVLADYAAASMPLDSLDGTGTLVRALREARAEHQAKVLSRRLVAIGGFHIFLEESDHKALFRFGRQPDGTPAAPWTWHDLTDPVETLPGQ